MRLRMRNEHKREREREKWNVFAIPLKHNTEEVSVNDNESKERTFPFT